MTTITVDDETRRRLKRLSAILNMSQGEIVKVSLDLFERLMLSKNYRAEVLLPRKVVKILEEISRKVREEDPEWGRRSTVIEEAAEGPEEAIWGLEI